MSNQNNWVSRILVLPCLFVFFISNVNVNAQDRNSLEKQRLRIIEKIEQTARLLKDNKASKKNTITDFNLLESQINFREELIENIDFEISQAEELMVKSRKIMDSLNNEIQTLQNRYIRLLRALYIRKQAQNPLGNLLSIKSINDAFQRWSYIKQYETRNQRQAVKIMQSYAKSSKQIEQLQFYKTQREKLINIEKEHQDILEEELGAKQGILKDLSDDEINLRNKLQKHHSNREVFNGAIESLIIAELASGEKVELSLNLPEIEENRNRTNKNTSSPKSSFERSKGTLPWPVDKGIVVQRYGKQNHPTIHGVGDALVGAFQVRLIFF